MMATRAQIERLRARIERLTPPASASPAPDVREQFVARLDGIASRLQLHAIANGEPWPPVVSVSDLTSLRVRFDQLRAMRASA